MSARSGTLFADSMKSKTHVLSGGNSALIKHDSEHVVGVQTQTASHYRRLATDGLLPVECKLSSGQVICPPCFGRVDNNYK